MFDEIASAHEAVRVLLAPEASVGGGDGLASFGDGLIIAVHGRAFIIFFTIASV